MSITEEQKRIYNHHLSTYKRHQNKPYTLRANFDEFEKEKPEEYVCLVKLESFFNNHDHVNRKLYFDAPYRIYEDRDYFDLCYYTSQAAIKCYTLYLKQLNEQSIDAPSQIEFIKDTLTFIKDYCILHRLPLLQYLNFKENLTFTWATHIAEHKTSIYVIQGFDYFNFRIYDHMFEMQPDERELLLENIVENYATYKAKLDSSKLAKKLIIEGLKIIDKSINESLKSV